MSLSRVFLAIVSFCLVLAHLSGNMKALIGAFDIDISARNIPYLLIIPSVAVLTVMMLRN